MMDYIALTVAHIVTVAVAVGLAILRSKIKEEG